MMKLRTRKLISLIVGAVFSLQVSAAGFPFQPNEILNAADLNNALQKAAITSGTIDSVTMTNSIISGSIGAFTSLTSPSVSITGGLMDNVPIGTVTPVAGAFTTLAASSVSLSGGSINNTPIGNTTPSTGAFTTLAASSVSLSNGTMTSVTVDNSPIGTVTPASGVFSALSSSSVSITGGTVTGVTLDNTPVGSSVPSTGSFTTLAASSVISLGGTDITTIFAPISSPAFTGVPTAPTATFGTNTTQLATTAFVHAEVFGNFTGSKIQPVSAAVAANALTVQLNPTTLDFRSTTLTDGVPVTVSSVAAISVTVPASATLGTINSVQSRLMLVALNNAGTMELAIVNQAGGNNLDETSLISTSAVSATSNSNNVIYSTSARTNVAFRVVGYIEITEATAGTWATGPTLVQGYGGQAGSAMQSAGQGQTWQDMTASRAGSTTYYNTTNKQIAISLKLSVPSSGTPLLTVNGLAISQFENRAATTGVATLYVTVPPGESYSATLNTATITGWYEQR
jgi:hypothetical protein